MVVPFPSGLTTGPESPKKRIMHRAARIVNIDTSDRLGYSPRSADQGISEVTDQRMRTFRAGGDADADSRKGD
jgi:hypothetical protein